jgi:hypothetical protein
MGQVSGPRGNRPAPVAFALIASGDTLWYKV